MITQGCLCQPTKAYGTFSPLPPVFLHLLLSQTANPTFSFKSNLTIWHTFKNNIRIKHILPKQEANSLYMLGVIHSSPYINHKKNYKKKTHSLDATGSEMDINQLLFPVFRAVLGMLTLLTSFSGKNSLTPPARKK